MSALLSLTLSCVLCATPLLFYSLSIGWGERVNVQTVSFVFLLPSLLLLLSLSLSVHYLFFPSWGQSWVEGEGERGMERVVEVVVVAAAAAECFYLLFWSVLLVVCWLFGVWIPRAKRWVGGRLRESE